MDLGPLTTTSCPIYIVELTKMPLRDKGSVEESRILGTIFLWFVSLCLGVGVVTGKSSPAVSNFPWVL